ncbi:hypothetical protein [Larkinella soli]|uniref:hypothetical protein n=1 Tax=Larkinella soli TaxID=1770527 RepID=UPI000FFB8CCB|nr:hypothetical protein [Larkinella soli]
MTTSTAKFAEKELSILIASSDDPGNRPLIEEFIPEILALCEKFGLSGQSGGSAPYAAGAIADAIRKLCLFQPLCPITGMDEEWFNVTDLGSEGQLFQNCRLSSVFKKLNGKAYYLDAIVWKTQTGSTWSGSAFLPGGTKIMSRQFIKQFPFTPKTFYIDVIEEEIAKDDWKFTIIDEKQLEEVFSYYQKPA